MSPVCDLSTAPETLVPAVRSADRVHPGATGASFLGLVDTVAAPAASGPRISSSAVTSAKCRSRGPENNALRLGQETLSGSGQTM